MPQQYSVPGVQHFKMDEISEFESTRAKKLPEREIAIIPAPTPNTPQASSPRLRRSEAPTVSHLSIRYLFSSSEEGPCLEFDIRHNPKVEELLEDAKRRFSPDLDWVPVPLMWLRPGPISDPFLPHFSMGKVTRMEEFPTNVTLYLTVIWDFVRRFLDGYVQHLTSCTGAVYSSRTVAKGNHMECSFKWHRNIGDQAEVWYEEYFWHRTQKQKDETIGLVGR